MMNKVYLVIGKKYAPAPEHYVPILPDDFEECKLVKPNHPSDGITYYINENDWEDKIYVLTNYGNVACYKSLENYLKGEEPDYGVFLQYELKWEHEDCIGGIVGSENTIFAKKEDAIAYVKKKNPSGNVKDDGTMYACKENGMWEYFVLEKEIKND